MRCYTTLQKNKMDYKDILKLIASFLLLILVGFILFKVSSLLVYVLVSLIFSLILSPFNSFLKVKLKFNKTISSIFSITLLISFFSLLVGIVIPVVSKQGKNLALLDTEKFRSKVQLFYDQISVYFESKNTTIYDIILNLNFISDLDFGFATKLFNSLVSQAGSLSIGIMSVLFITFFFIKDGKDFFNGFISLFSKKQKVKISKSFLKVESLLSRYFIGVFIQIIILFFLYTIMLSIIGVENFFAIAFLCAILNIIPYLGPLISIILIITLSFTSSIDVFVINEFLKTSFVLVIGFLIVQSLDNFLLQPYIFSSSIKSHPLEVFLVIIFSGLLFGVFGLIIAIPLYTTLKVIVSNFINIKRLLKNI